MQMQPATVTGQSEGACASERVRGRALSRIFGSIRYSASVMLPLAAAALALFMVLPSVALGVTFASGPVTVRVERWVTPRGDVLGVALSQSEATSTAYTLQVLSAESAQVISEFTPVVGMTQYFEAPLFSPVVLDGSGITYNGCITFRMVDASGEEAPGWEDFGPQFCDYGEGSNAASQWWPDRAPSSQEATLTFPGSIEVTGAVSVVGTPTVEVTGTPHVHVTNPTTATVTVPESLTASVEGTLPVAVESIAGVPTPALAVGGTLLTFVLGILGYRGFIRG